MQTLKIEIPKGYEIDSFDKLSGEIKFKAAKPKNVMERIKTIDDVLADNGITQSTFNDWSEGLSQDEVAYRTLKLLTKSLNEGWVPDWSNSKEYKYFPWFEMNGSSGFRFCDDGFWYSTSAVGSRLCFKTSELAEYAGRQFTFLYNRFLIIQ
ncbi:MAG TPA: hypothetical protein VK589_24295 [Chryseolinea sp.]|nr:hypothetical protein [Chryseolinea sp.]